MPDLFTIALHGGAGVQRGRDYAEVERHLDALVRACHAQLAAGDAALDVVERAVADMEASGLYVAGRGSAPTSQGHVECDASIMDGTRMLAGGVCAVRDIVSPIAAARAVLENTPFVLLAGEGARDFALSQGCLEVRDAASHYRVPVGVEEAEMASLDSGLSHGTVGAVALDIAGHLAAATSTGGLFGKRPGRVGDTALTGIGNWADGQIAVSCTGIGEAFIYAGGARNMADQMRYGSASLGTAAKAMLSDVAAHAGDGGLIAIDAAGNVVSPFNSPGMKRAISGSHVATQISIY